MDFLRLVMAAFLAVQLNAVDELLCSEMIFENILTPLEPAEIAALLSTLVFEEKVDGDPVIPEGIQEVCFVLTAVLFCCIVLCFRYCPSLRC